MPSTVVRTMGEGGVVTLRLNRPEKKNALTREMYAALSDGLRSAAEDEAVRVVLLAGGEDFTAGNDIADFAADAARRRAATASSARAPPSTSLKPSPVSRNPSSRRCAAWPSASAPPCCSTATPPSRRGPRGLQMPFTRLGIVPEAGSSLLLAARVGQARATWLLHERGRGGRRDGGAGRAGRRAPWTTPRWRRRPVAMAAQLAALPPGAVADTKRLLRAAYAQPLVEAMERERAAISERLRSAEARALFDAFLNRKS